VLATAGCGGSGSSADQGDSKKSAGASEAEAAPAPLSEDEYQAVLDGTGAGVTRALASARRASSPDGLTSRLEKSATALDTAADKLDGAGAPEAAAGAHADVVAGLRGLASALTSAAGRVGSGGLCTSPAALAHVTRSAAAGDLRSSAAALREAGFDAKGLAPKRQRMPALRLKTGMVLTRKGGTGPGELVIRNGNSREGVVKLVAGAKRTTVYVGRKANATVTQIPDGNYRVFFATGVSWDGARNTFSRSCGFTRFDENMKFTSGGGRYVRFTITLNAVKGGSARTSQIDPSDFPRG